MTSSFFFNGCISGAPTLIVAIAGRKDVCTSGSDGGGLGREACPSNDDMAEGEVVV